ncbi:JAB domain-containing protein [Pedobacter borealis]|uniref:JAB domain-containing protein n=1 Tax=Pedobacter borealis TaxID=475254 RepID=UPI002476FDC6|nr:JAB domain-containing protein [Pedobacter borealis]
MTKHENKHYILFVNEKQHVFSWYKIQEFGKAGNCLQQITGLAQACNAYEIVLLKYCNKKEITIDAADELFINICFNACEKVKIDIIDYIICNPKTYLSYRKKCLND